MRLRHPAGDDLVDVHGDLVPVDADDTFEAPESWAEAFAARYDTTVEALRVDGSDGSAETKTCETVKTDGEICGRDLPCPYHD